MSLATIIYEGVRRSLSQEQLDDILLPFMESFLAVHDDPLHRFQDIALEADERRLVTLVDGRRIMREVIERSELPRLTASQLVYALLAAEMIKPLARKTKGSDRAEPPPLRQKPPPLKPRKDRPPPLKGRGLRREAVLPPSTLDGLDTTEMRTRLATRLHEVKNLDHFEILGVSKTASTAEIRRAYFAEVGDLHPDRLRAASADVRDLAERLQATLTAAYETLSDSEQRAAYKKSLDATLRDQVGLFVGQILEADGSFVRGLRALHKEEWAQAIANFRDAAELYPEDPEPWAYLGWSRFNAGGDFSTEEAEEDLMRSITLGPKSDRGHLYYGLMCAELGRTSDAQQHLEEAVASNPDSREALDGLRMVRGRA